MTPPSLRIVRRMPSGEVFHSLLLLFGESPSST